MSSKISSSICLTPTAMSENKIFKTTGIGSLNTTSVNEAISYSLQHDLIFLPQLPHIEGDMIYACKNKISLCLNRIKDQAQGRSLKIQLPGPRSSKLPLKDILAYYDHLKSKLTGIEIITFIDEPYFPNISKELMEIIEVIRKNDKVGVHCCGDFNIEDLDKLQLDYFSYDYNLVKKYSEKELLNSSQNLILGIVPTLGPFDFETTVQKLNSRAKNFAENIFLSASCGLADKKINMNEVLKNLEKTKSYLAQE